MPAPTFKGTFPVTLSQSTKYYDRGKVEFSVTKAYQISGVVTGTIGTRDNTLVSGITVVLTGISVKKAGGIAEVTQTYTGGDASAPDVYEVVASVSEEPIASHVAFTASTGIYTTSIVNASGGAITQDSGASGGAIFTTAGQFVEFTKTATNAFFGVQSYLSPQITYRRIYSAGTVPSSGITTQVSLIFSTPDGDPPTIASGRNWLLTSLVWKCNGNQVTGAGQYEITKEFRASGNKGWNNAIYYTAN
jgi:hypothetical protein